MGDARAQADGWRAIALIAMTQCIVLGTAVRLTTDFQTSAEVWLNLQTRYNLRIAATAVGEKVNRAVRPHRSAA